MRPAFALVACLLVSAPALADAPSPADQAFERGRAALAAGKYDDACAAFEESLRLDFQYGTLFNLADCNDKRGKLATSLALWTRIANEDKNQGRAQRARELAAVLEKRVPRVRLTLTPPTAAKFTLDGTAIASVAEPIPVDIGSHEIVAVATDGREARRVVKTLEEGAMVVVGLTLETETAASLPPPPPPESSGSSGRATAGKVFVVLGGATLATGLVFGGLAMTKWSSAEDTAMTDVAGANGDVDKVELYGNLSTGLIAGGAVAVGIGIYLWRSGSHTRPVAALGPGSATFGIAGGF